MEFLVPIGIIIYVVLAVVGAVLRGLSPQPSPVPQERPEPAEILEEPLFPQPELVQPRVYAEAELEDFPDDEPAMRRPTSGAPVERSYSVTKKDLRQAVIMSEILREPRAQRPWPSR